MNQDRFRFPTRISDAVRSFLRPAPNETVEQWLGRCIMLARGTDSPGYVSLSNFPYARKVVELAKSRKQVQVVLCWPAQSSKTQTMFSVAAYRGRNMPADTLFATANQVMSTGYSTRRWLPVLYDSPVMREIFPADRRRISGPTQRFLTHNMIWTGSHSEANLRGNPCRDLYGDEIDVWAEGTDDSESALGSFMQRNKAFAGGFTMLASTPTTRSGAIWKLLLAGTNERFFVKCQHCGHHQFMTWPQVKWPDDCRDENGQWNLAGVTEKARIHCEKCDGPHNNGDRLRIVQDGQWAALNASAMPNEYSFNLNCLYVAHPKSALGNVAARYCRALNTRNVELLRSFITNDLAEPFEPKLHGDGTAIEAAQGDYDLGDDWDKCRWKTSHWDVQQDRFEGEIRGWSEDADSRLIWEGTAATFAEIHALNQKYGVPAHHCGLDSGYTPQRIYDACTAYGWQALKGEGRGHYLSDEQSVDGQPIQTIWRESLVAMSDGRHIPLLLWSSQGAQDYLAFLLSGAGPSYSAARNVSDRYKQGMKSHAKEERGGKWQWVRVSRNDHAWDAATMGVVLAVRLGILAKAAV